MTEPPPRLRYLCEVCGVEAILTSAAAMAAGWDHPPGMCDFGVVGPRICPTCDLTRTVWWALHEDPNAELTAEQRAVLERIAAEPESMKVDGD